MSSTDRRLDVLLVCSAGGHLLQLLALREAWVGCTHAWVTDDTDDARSLLRDETVVYAYGPTDRNLPNLARNAGVAWRILRRQRPQVMITTGAALAVPFAWLARLWGTRVIYVESLTRIESASLSCRLVAPVANRLYVQWPELGDKLRKAHYAGAVVSRP